MFRLSLILMVAYEAVSFAAYETTILGLVFLVLTGVAVFLVAFKNLEWGSYLLFGELFFGSRGRLLEYEFISLRMVVFGAVFLAWLVRGIMNYELGIRKLKTIIHDSRFLIQYCLLLAVIAWGIIWGYISNQSLMNVFQDANGYLYLLILPAVLAGIRNRGAVENLLEILAAAIVVIGAKTLFLFIWFSYGLPGVASIYHWVINRDIGEITGVVGSASRVFMQSQFWALMGLFIWGIGESSEIRGRRLLIVSAAILAIILSLSRSFWLGLAVGALFAFIIMIFYLKVDFKKVLRAGLVLFLIAVLEIVALYLVIKIGAEGGIARAVSSRAINPAQEAAGSARLLLLPELLKEIGEAPLLGKGFGEQVTYQSYLPDRTTPENPTGEITSFAFEWGYLDIMLKVGLIGLLVYLFFIAAIFRKGWEGIRNQELGIRNLGMLSGLVALVVLNITTPYLNHPLGIGHLIFVFSYLFVIRRADEAAG